MAHPFHGWGIALPLAPLPSPPMAARPRRPPGAARCPQIVWQVMAFYMTTYLDMAEGLPGIKAPRPPQVGQIVNDSYLTDFIYGWRAPGGGRRRRRW